VVRCVAEDVNGQDRLSTLERDGLMEFSITREQRELRDRIVRFAKAELNRGLIERDRDQILSRELWRRCGDMGLLDLPVPTQYGGRVSTSCRPPTRSKRSVMDVDNGLVFSIDAHLLSCVVSI
jgi:hypothetical protein